MFLRKHFAFSWKKTLFFLVKCIFGSWWTCVSSSTAALRRWNHPNIFRLWLDLIVKIVFSCYIYQDLIVLPLKSVARRHSSNHTRVLSPHDSCRHWQVFLIGQNKCRPHQLLGRNEDMQSTLKSVFFYVFFIGQQGCFGLYLRCWSQHVGKWAAWWTRSSLTFSRVSILCFNSRFSVRNLWEDKVTTGSHSWRKSRL